MGEGRPLEELLALEAAYDEPVSEPAAIPTYLLWLAVPAAGLGIVAGGGMLLAGSPRAQRVLALTAIGFAIVVTAKGLVA